MRTWMNAYKRLGKDILSLGLYYAGGVWLFRKLSRWRHGPRVRVLAYHGVNDGPNYLDLFMDVEKFEEQIVFLKRNYDVIALDHLVDLLRRGERPSRDSVVITLDDGFKDYYETVLPLAVKHQVPMTIFLTTGCLDSGQPTFVYFLILAMERARSGSLDLTDLGLGVYSLDSHSKREWAVSRIDKHSRSLDAAVREKLLDAILARLGLSREDDFFKDRMLTWAEVNKMKGSCVSFGAHSVTHPVLSRIPLDEARREIETSRRRIIEETGVAPRVFAYPYGGRADINDDVIKAAQQAGFDAAVVLTNETFSPENLYRIGRVMVTDDMTTSYWGGFAKAVFAAEMSGIFDRLFFRS